MYPVRRKRSAEMADWRLLKKSKTTNFQTDRFIPKRSAMNFEMAHFDLLQPRSVDPAPLQQVIWSHLFGKDRPSILAFTKFPILKTQVLKRRHISVDRILDAPELRPDFYLNILDWSSLNIVAVALNEIVYLWNASDGAIMELCELAKDESNEEDIHYITSVCWMANGLYLAVGTSKGEIQIWNVMIHKKVKYSLSF